MASSRDMARLIDNKSDECNDEAVNKGDEENASDECSDQAAYTTETIKECRVLKPGDHIAIRTKLCGFIPCYHHGIFLSLDRGVAEIAPDPTDPTTTGKSTAFPRISDIDTFINYNSDNQPIVRRNYSKGNCRLPEETIKTAMYYVENREAWGKFHLTQRNCEHFATMCKTGISASAQLDILAKIPLGDKIST